MCHYVIFHSHLRRDRTMLCEFCSTLHVAFEITQPKRKIVSNDGMSEIHVVDLPHMILTLRTDCVKIIQSFILASKYL